MFPPKYHHVKSKAFVAAGDMLGQQIY